MAVLNTMYARLRISPVVFKKIFINFQLLDRIRPILQILINIERQSLDKGFKKAIEEIQMLF